MKPEINLQLFAEKIKAKRGDITLRDAASQIGKVSAGTLSRCEQAKLPDLNTFVRVCRWLDIFTEAFVVQKIRVINAKATTEYFDERQKKPDTPEWVNEIVETVRREREQDQIERDRIMKEAFEPRPASAGVTFGGVVDSREETWPEEAQIKSMYFIPNEQITIIPEGATLSGTEGYTLEAKEPFDLLGAIKKANEEENTQAILITENRVSKVDVDMTEEQRNDHIAEARLVQLRQERILSQIKDDIENEGQPKPKPDNEDSLSMTPPYFHEHEDRD